MFKPAIFMVKYIKRCKFLIPAGKISRDNFKKMLKGKEGYIPRNTLKGLEKMGKSGLLNKGNVSKADFEKIAKTLQGEGLIPKNKRSAQLIQAAEKQQQKSHHDFLESQKHQGLSEEYRQAIFADEREEMEREIETEKNPYQRGSSLYQELEKETRERQKQNQIDRDKKEKHDKPKSGKPPKMTLTDNLPDLDIG